MNKHISAADTSIGGTNGEVMGTNKKPFSKRSSSQIDDPDVRGLFGNSILPDKFEKSAAGVIGKRSGGGGGDGEETGKSTYGRLRVLTAPSASAHELNCSGTNATTILNEPGLSQKENNVLPYSFDSVTPAAAVAATSATLPSQRLATTASQRSQFLQHLNSIGCGGTHIGTAANRRSATSTNLRPSSAGGGGSASTQRLSSGGSTTRGSGGGGGDHSVTQFALIDDENVSALQQVTKGGGALTLASQWKSQFDDSEETTDNEWKQEPQVNKYTEKYS